MTVAENDLTVAHVLAQVFDEDNNVLKVNSTDTGEDSTAAVLGTTSDAAVTTDATATISARIRGLVNIIKDVWVSASHALGAVLVAGEAHIGQVGGHSAAPVATAFVCDTGILASGEVITDTLEIDSAVRVANGTGWLTSLVLIDKDDQGAAIDVYFFRANVSLGTKNSTPSISDSDAANFLGKVSIATTDWTDLGGVRVAHPTVKPFVVKGGGTGNNKIYASVLNGTGTPTFTASGLLIAPGIIQD